MALHEIVFDNEPSQESKELWTKALLIAYGVELPADVEIVSPSERVAFSVEK
ncbi:hypothetical protein [Paenibacillus humicus]|uniref:hypothetical protein n=1 Tax=Paenibacillus humicus TaxID=412861 RepID=UPI003F149868